MKPGKFHSADINYDWGFYTVNLYLNSNAVDRFSIKRLIKFKNSSAKVSTVSS
jgi:hypothetical protein